MSLIKCQKDQEVYELLLDAPEGILTCIRYIATRRGVGLYEALCGAIYTEAYLRDLEQKGKPILTLEEGEVKELKLKGKLL